MLTKLGVYLFHLARTRKTYQYEETVMIDFFETGTKKSIEVYRGRNLNTSPTQTVAGTIATLPRRSLRASKLVTEPGPPFSSLFLTSFNKLCACDKL
jgi:hypothetical protein